MPTAGGFAACTRRILDGLALAAWPVLSFALAFRFKEPATATPVFAAPPLLAAANAAAACATAAACEAVLLPTSAATASRSVTISGRTTLPLVTPATARDDSTCPGVGSGRVGVENRLAGLPPDGVLDDVGGTAPVPAFALSATSTPSRSSSSFTPPDPAPTSSPTVSCNASARGDAAAYRRELLAPVNGNGDAGPARRPAVSGEREAGRRSPKPPAFATP